MKPLDLILTFHGIKVPTAPVFGKAACCMTVGRLIEGREQKSNRVLFAYQEGDVWKATFFDEEPGQFRLTLVSNTLRCSRDVTIDDPVLASGALQVDFRREDCRRQWVPVWVKRWWWKLRDHRARRCNDPSRDERVLSQYRRRFRRGPVGTWLSDSELTLYGTSFEFRPDFTGSIVSWGYDEEVPAREFRWNCVGDCAIEVQPIDGEFDRAEWGIVRYDFKTSRSPYGNRQLLMYDPNKPKYVENGPGFWHSCEPVVLTKPTS